MSHLAQRKEKNCLNCGTTVVGKYCHNCGQENVDPKESVWQLLSHFFSDITHFDGKFFSTLKDLLFKPGFLSKEYMNGRRARYLNPIRMYLFTSFIFFLVFFSSFHFDDKKFGNLKLFSGKTIEQINTMNQEDFDTFTKLLNKGNPMSREEFKHYADSVTAGGILVYGEYKSKGQYDSLLNAGVIQHGWLKRKLAYKAFEINKNMEPGKESF